MLKLHRMGWILFWFALVALVWFILQSNNNSESYALFVGNGGSSAIADYGLSKDNCNWLANMIEQIDGKQYAIKYCHKY